MIPAAGGGGGSGANTIAVAYGETGEVAATAEADILAFNAVAALADADGLITQATITGFDAAADSLQLDIETAGGVSTLDELDGVDGIAVQSNAITGQTLINFGNDANGGEVVSIALQGVTDATLVEVEAI